MSFAVIWQRCQNPVMLGAGCVADALSETGNVTKLSYKNRVDQLLRGQKRAGEIGNVTS
jgi:hypothetical protein